jgi:hypothetical protein
MSLKRRLRPRLLRAAAGLSLCAGMGAAIGCTAYPTLKALPLDCTVEGAYDFLSVDTFDTVSDPATGWFVSGDTSSSDAGSNPDANPNAPIATVTVETLADGARCGSNAAMVIRSAHHNDWGSLAGDYAFAPATLRDASMFEGLSFWGRAPGNTNKSFTILLDDANTHCSGTADTSTGLCPDPPGAYCKTYATPDGGTAIPPGTYVDPMTGMAISGTTMAAAPPDACGNGYTVVATVTADWRLYTIPFGTFHQGSMPNRVPNSVFTQTGSVPGTNLLTAKLTGLTIRMPKEATMELWIDNLSFYRKKGAATRSDGGADAR